MKKCFNYVRKKLQRKEKNRGITLIALVITVIILLILAGTAITLGIDGGNLFGKTNEAATKWNAAVANEEKSIGDLLEIMDMAANPDLAKYRLTVKVNEDKTVESPYYVNYPSAKGTIKCRVLYNDSTYGLQIVSVNPVTTVTLGENDPNTNVTGEMGSVERAQNSYNRAIMTLNEKAEEYKETTDGSVLATDARCVGSDPLNKNYPDNLTGEAREAEMFVADSNDTYMNEYNGKIFKGDSHYATDKTRLGKIGASRQSSYWLASRGTYMVPDYGYYFCPNYVSGGSINRYGFLRVNTDGTMIAQGCPAGLRPVFILASGVKITGGEGTEDNPFELGL